MLNFNKNYILYGCKEKTEYEEIKDSIELINYKTWRLCSIAFCVGFFALFVIGAYGVGFNSRTASYAGISGVSLLAFILLITIMKNNHKGILILSYVLSAALLLFGILIGIFFQPNHPASTFHVILFGLPLLITDRPHRVGIMELLAVITFLFCTFMVKSGVVLNLDIQNCFFTWFIAQLITYYVSTGRMRQFITAKRLELAGITDQLTKLYNRKAYEDDIEEFERLSPEEQVDFTYVAFDINGLKKMNDTKGHAAGDSLVIGSARCIENTAGSDAKCYRIGGDEFVIMGFVDEEKYRKLQKRFLRELEVESKKIVGGISLAKGKVTKKEFPELSISELAKVADKRMYNDKANYYLRAGIDRRQI